MIDLDTYQSLKKRADKLRTDAERAEGALEQHMKKLAETFGCQTVEEAESRLEELTEKENELEAAYNKALQEFEGQFGQLI